MLNRYLCLLFLASTLAIAKDPNAASNYRTFFVANRINISVPSHWHPLDENSRRNLAAAAESLLDGKESAHVASLAVNAVPAPAGAIVRVSLIDADGLSQSELISAVKSDPNGTNKELDAVGNDVVTNLDRQLRPTGMRILGRANTTVEAISGKLAIAIHYRRTSPQAGATFNVTQYHIPLGAKKAIITLSYREQDAIVFSTILKKVKSSIVIR